MPEKFFYDLVRGQNWGDSMLKSEKYKLSGVFKRSIAVLAAASMAWGCAIKHVRGPDPQVIIDAYKSHKQGVQDCYYRALEKNSTLAGEVTMAWTVLGSGVVDSAWIKETSLDHQGLESCLLSHLKSVQFPKTKRFAKISVEYTLSFKKISE